MATALAAGKVSSLELTQDAIARIESHDAPINAICIRDFDNALAAARAADAALASGERRPLLGIPMTIKESFNMQGLPTTWGIPQHRRFLPEEDALAVQRVKTAGAVILGKTNVPIKLLDFQSYNDIYGATRNPFDLALTAGGSSGGSSAALAAGYAPLSLGSDIAGSLRAPAHFCGIFAHKPTLELVPTRGHISPGNPPLPIEQDLGVIGPMARCASDLALLLDVVAGPDHLEKSAGYKLSLPPARYARLEHYRVLVLDTHPLIATSASVSTALEDLVRGLSKAGVKITRDSASVPDLAASARLYMRLLMSTVGAKWSPEDYSSGMHEAARLSASDDSLEAERIRGAVLSHRDWRAADFQRATLRSQWRAAFRDYDVVICPVTPTPAYPHDHSPNMRTRTLLVDGKVYPYYDQFAWCSIATLPGLPATAFPVGMTPQGIPVGMQVIGAWHEDHTTIKFAELVEAELGGLVPPPMLKA
jgi:amidase